MAPKQLRAPIQNSPRATVQAMGAVHLAAIDQLPDDVLGEIFASLRDDTASFRRDKYNNDEVEQISLAKIEWVAVTHVCRRWRGVAFAISTLWNEPPVLLPLWASAMLQRSRMAPIRSLDIDWEVMREEAISTALRHTPRVKKLALRLLDSSHFEATLLRELTGVAAPALEDLTIYPNRSSKLIRNQSEPGCYLPDNLFSNANNLKSLDLASMGINWSSHLLSSLTELTLFNVPYSRRPTVRELRSMLERMPDLEFLVLVEALPLTAATAGSNTRVSLPKLKHLHFSGRSIELKVFISNVTPGNKLDWLRIIVCHEGETTDELNGCQRALTEQCPLDDVELLHIASNESGAVWVFDVLTIVSTGTGPDLHEEKRKWKFDICALEYSSDDGLSWPDDHHELRYVQLFDTFSWKKLSHLDLNPLDCPDAILPSSTVLALTFGTLPSLRTITIGNRMAPLLIDALKYKPVEAVAEKSRDRPLAPFRGLELIYMVSVSFFEEDESKPHLHMKELVECARDRFEKGFPIHSITLKGCTGVVQEEADELRKVLTFRLRTLDASGAPIS